MRTLKRPALLLVLGALFLSGPAFGDMRETFEDDQIVARSELIVVGRIDVDSLVFVKKAAPDGRARAELRSTLIVSAVLKGKLDEKRLPLYIHDGLTVDIDGAPIIGPNRQGQWGKDRTGAIAIYDTGNSVLTFTPLVDAAKDVIWFLRPVETKGVLSAHAKFGVFDPEDMQPAELKDYFRAYLADDREAAVKRYVDKHAEVAVRAGNALDHIDIERILQIEDPDERARRLAPYYTTVTRRSMSGQVREGLLGCGAVAGPYLLDAYENPRNVFARRDVVHMWGRIRWDGCVRLLIDLLDDNNRFFAGQTLEAGWPDGQTDPVLTEARDARYSETLTAVYSLGRIGDARARDVIEQTKQLWQQKSDPEAPRMAETCDEALRSLAADE